MAQLLIIKAETARDGLQYIGDVVGIFHDSHVFSGTELEKFSVLTINGSREDVQAIIDRITPDINHAYLWTDGKHYWTGEGIEDEPDVIIDVFRIEGSNRWYRLDNDFVFPVNIDSLTPEEKQLLETVDINHPAVDSFIRKLVKDVAALSGNDVEIKDLRNTSPG